MQEQHTITHIEIPAPDIKKAIAFYSALFNWQIELQPQNDYAFFRIIGTGSGGGLDAKPRDQVLAAYLPDEPHAQFHEREPVALRLGQICKLFVRHPGLAGSVSECCSGSFQRVYGHLNSMYIGSFYY